MVPDSWKSRAALFNIKSTELTWTIEPVHCAVKCFYYVLNWCYVTLHLSSTILFLSNVALCLCYSYSSPVDAQALPISYFCYQEPENDPRSFCYLWVARCSGVSSAVTLSDSMQEYIAGTMASISLYQLAYDMKSFTDAGNVLFKVCSRI